MIRFFWRLLVRSARPKQPFIFRTGRYSVWVDNTKGSITRAFVRRGAYEKVETELFVKALRPGDTVVDVGANFGHYTLTAAHAVGPSGRVYAFEPNPASRDLLVRNIALNGFRNVTVDPHAIASEAGTAVLHVDSGNSGGHSILAGDDASGIVVPLLPLREALRLHGHGGQIKAIKIDTEGAEAYVLDGAWEIIERDRPAILLEFAPDSLEKCNRDPLSIVERIESLGYQITLIDPFSGLVRPCRPKDVLEYAAESGRAYVNLLFKVDGNGH